MKEEGVVLLIFTVIAIVFLVLTLFYHLLKPSEVQQIDPTVYTDPYAGITYWEPLNVDTSNSNDNCSIYNFPANTVYTDCENNTCKGYQGIPTTDLDVIDSKTPQQLTGCYYQDQLPLSLQSRVCKSRGGDTYTLSKCTKIDGTQAEVGEIEYYYEDTCNVSSCGGNLSHLAINYDVSNSNDSAQNGLLCINSDIELRQCDIMDSNQTVIVNRSGTSSSQESGTYSESSFRSGQYANIFFRNIGMYLATTEGELSMVSTSEKTWLMVQQMNAPPLTGSSTSRYSPQQMLDITGLSSTDVSNLFGATQSDTMDNIINSGLKSLQTSSNALVLRPFVVGTDPSSTKYAATQYIDYSLYNDIIFGNTYYAF